MMKSNLIETLYRNLNWIVGGIVIAVLAMFFSQKQVRQVTPPDSNRWFQSVVLEESRPVLVKFGAEWCGPCLRMDRSLEEYAKSGDVKVKVVRIDIDQQPELAKHFGVRSIPRSFIFHDGKILADKVGGLDTDRIRQWVDGTLN